MTSQTSLQQNRISESCCSWCCSVSLSWRHLMQVRPVYAMSHQQTITSVYHLYDCRVLVRSIDPAGDSRNAPRSRYSVCHHAPASNYKISFVQNVNIKAKWGWFHWYSDDLREDDETEFLHRRDSFLVGVSSGRGSALPGGWRHSHRLRALSQQNSNKLRIWDM